MELCAEVLGVTGAGILHAAAPASAWLGWPLGGCPLWRILVVTAVFAVGLSPDVRCDAFRR